MMKRALRDNVEIPPAWRLRFFEAIDNKGAFIAPVLDVLWDVEAHEPRYVLLEIGGGVGVTGKRIILPEKAVVRLGGGQVQALYSQQTVFDVPVPRDPEHPKREEEEEIFQYFDLPPYWMEGEGLEMKKDAGAVGGVKVPKKPLPPPPDINPDELKMERDSGKNGH